MEVGPLPFGPAPPPAAAEAARRAELRRYNPLARGEGSSSGGEASGSDGEGSDGSGYDSGEEYLRGLQSRAAYAAMQCRELGRQQETLRQYREQQALKAELEQEMERMKASMAEEEAWRHADDDDRRRAERAAEAAAASLSAALDAEDAFGSGEAAAAWAAHEEQWAAFEASPPEEITEADVPWPPNAEKMLASAAALEVAAAGRDGVVLDPYDAHKKAFRKYSLRWHPDKFASKFGQRLSAAPAGAGAEEGATHADVVNGRVLEVVKSLNEAWDKIDKP